MTRSAHIKALKESMENNRDWWEMNIRIYKNNLKDDGKISLADPDGVYRLFSKDFILGIWESIYPTTPKVVKNVETKGEKKVTPKVEKKADTVNVDALMASINNLRMRNSELVSQVGKMKNEIKSANDEIAELKKMLEIATLKIAELEDANQELSIYKELVEEETQIEE